MLIKNVKIYTGYADRPPFIGWVEIREGRFLAIGEGHTDAEGMDGEGLSLIPGLIDAHTHLGIVGDSGSGKTTLGQALCHLIPFKWCIEIFSKKESLFFILFLLSYKYIIFYLKLVY